MLRGVCYRMTGSAADAEDLVQETFVRAMERPPASLDEPLAPWLLRVAVNLGRDALRKRRRRSYVGTWLPSPVDVEEVASFEIEGETEGRYDMIESVSFAFLVALEALTPNQRAVVLLRDVLDRSVRETSEALRISEANVKVLHHRARRALAPYEASREATRPSAEVSKSTAEALQRFMAAMGSGDERAIASVFAEGAESWADGGGVYLATRLIVKGGARVARLFAGLTKKSAPIERLAIHVLNGVPMLVTEHASVPRHAPRSVLGIEVDAEGRITRIYSVLAPAKLTHVRRI